MGKFIMVSGVDPDTNLDLIDKEIIRLTGKTNPKILFVPTASGDDIKYCDRYREIYEGRFNCKLDALYLLNNGTTKEEVRNKVLGSDIIYIGGGSPERLMKYFKEYDMPNIFKEAIDKDIVLAGISAGAICMGTHTFYSEEAEDFEREGFDNYIKVECMGFFDFVFEPHYNLKCFSKRINAIVREYNTLGIALDNNCALEIIDNTYRIITSKESANAYALYLQNGEIIKKIIKKESRFRNIKELQVSVS